MIPRSHERFRPLYRGTWKPGDGGLAPKPETCAAVLLPAIQCHPATYAMGLTAALHLRAIETVALVDIPSRAGFRAIGMPPCFGDTRDTQLRREMALAVTQSHFVLYLTEGTRCIPYWNRALGDLLRAPQWDILIPQVVAGTSIARPTPVPDCAVYRRSLLQRIPWLSVGVRADWPERHWAACTAAGARIRTVDTLRLEVCDARD